jgi:hypothetical protein
MDVARVGNLEALKWAREHGPRPGSSAREHGRAMQVESIKTFVESVYEYGLSA